MNPLVNAGAIATTSLLPGSTVEDKWAYVLDGPLRASPADRWSLDQAVYESEAATNLRNRGIAHLLESYGQHHASTPTTPPRSTPGSARCSVTAEDLAVMGATLADGGVEPAHREAGDRDGALPPRARGDGHRRAVRGVRRVALRGRAAREERGERRHRDRVTREGRPGHLLPSPRRRRATACAGGCSPPRSPRRSGSTSSRRTSTPTSGAPATDAVSRVRPAAPRAGS